MISQHCIFLLVNSQNAFLLLIMMMIQCHSFIQPLPAQQTVLCLMTTYPLGTHSLLPIMPRSWLDQVQLSWTKVIPQHQTLVTICMTNIIGAVCSRWLFRVLFDSGSNVCMIKKSALPHNLLLKELSTSQDVKTLAGRLTAHQVVTLQDIHLPEFDKNWWISQ